MTLMIYLNFCVICAVPKADNATTFKIWCDDKLNKKIVHGTNDFITVSNNVAN